MRRSQQRERRRAIDKAAKAEKRRTLYSAVLKGASRTEEKIEVAEGDHSRNRKRLCNRHGSILSRDVT